MIKRFWSPESGFFIGLLLFFLLIGRTSLFRDPGTFWHIVVGDRILHEGFFDTDSLSFTRAGEPWIPNQWLAECSMAALYWAADLDGLLLYTAVVLAATYAFVAGRFVRTGFHWLPTVMLIGLVVGASSHHFHARPHVLTIALLGLIFARLVDVDAGKVPLQSLWWLVPVFVLWTNWHGGMLGGLMTLMLTIAGWITYPLIVKLILRGAPGLSSALSPDPSKTAFHGIGLSKGRLQTRNVATLLALVLACGMTVIVTPYGWRLPEAWRAIMTADLPNMIIEHRPLDLFSTEGLNNLLLSLLYLAALVSAARHHRPRVTWFVPLFWLWQAWSRMRHAPLFAVTAAIALADMLPYTTWIERVGTANDLYQPPEPAQVTSRGRHHNWHAWLVPTVAALLIFCLQTLHVPLPVLGHGWAKLDPTFWPTDPLLLADLRDAARKPDTRLFNEYAFGGFIMLYAPGLPVFIDDRCELYAANLLPTYVAVLRADPATRARQMQTWTREYGLNLALTHAPTAATRDPGRPFDDYFRSPEARSLGWRVMRQTTAGTLFARSAPASVPRDGNSGAD